MKIKLFVLGILFLVPFIFTLAQEPRDSIKTEIQKEGLEKLISPTIVKLSGEAGLYGELYSISGRERRRPGSSGRIFFRPTLTLFENFSIDFDIMLSTEGNSARQQINQIAIHPEWGWGKAHIGDFNHEFSPLILNGVTIRGGGLELYSNLFRFQIVGGQTQRAIQAGPYSSAYSRYLGGLKIGIGKAESSFFDLNVIRVRDNTASLPKDLFIKDSTASKSGSQFGVTPQENLVVGANTDIKFLDNMFRFVGEVAGSVFTRDMNSTTYNKEDIAEADMPTFIDDIYKIRLSSNADFAYSAELIFNHNIVNSKIGYSLINPGYTSLGLGSLINDRRNIYFSTGIRLFENKFNIQGNFQFQNDNLLKQKLYTLSRAMYSISANVRPIKEITFVVSTMRNNMSNDASSDTLKVNNINSTYSFNLMTQLQLLQMNHSISASYSTQFAEDLNILRKGSEVKADNLTFSLTTMLGMSWSVTPSVSINVVDIQNRSKNTTSSYNLRINNRMLNSKLSNSLTLGYSDATTTKSAIITLQSGLSITNADMITFVIRSSFYSITTGNTSDYQEHKANFGFTHRF
ncbi:MAG: hypothetical protein NTX22_05745 [Ignavibacteriales bacterium]|nr:hypothetical protein [Ignavibacteriales bacterium]